MRNKEPATSSSEQTALRQWCAGFFSLEGTPFSTLPRTMKQHARDSAFPRTGFITACSKNCQQFLRLSEEDVLGQQLVTIFKCLPARCTRAPAPAPSDPHACAFGCRCEAAEVSDIFERVGPRAFSSRMCLRQVQNSVFVLSCSFAHGLAMQCQVLT